MKRTAKINPACGDGENNLLHFLESQPVPLSPAQRNVSRSLFLVSSFLSLFFPLFLTHLPNLSNSTSLSPPACLVCRKQKQKDTASLYPEPDEASASNCIALMHCLRNFLLFPLYHFLLSCCRIRRNCRRRGYALYL